MLFCLPPIFSGEHHKMSPCSRLLDVRLTPMAHESNTRNGWKFTFKVFNERSCTFYPVGPCSRELWKDNVKRKVSKSCVSCDITAAASKHNTSNHCIIKSTEPVYCSMFPLSSEHWVSIFPMFLACQMTIIHCVLKNHPFGCREKWKICHEGLSSDLYDRLHIKWMPPFTEICRHGNTYF